MDRIKKLKIKKQDGTFSDYVPIGADAENIDTADGESVEVKLNKKPYYYDNVADMKVDTKLKTGDMVITFGYYEANDGGRAIYKIRTKEENETADETFTIAIGNTLIAELIIESDTINALQIGIKRNDSTFNSHDKIYNVAKNHNYTLFFPKGTYYISELFFDKTCHVDIKGESTCYEYKTIFEPYGSNNGYIIKCGGKSDYSVDSISDSTINLLKKIKINDITFRDWNNPLSLTKYDYSCCLAIDNCSDIELNANFYYCNTNGLLIRESWELQSQYLSFRGMYGDFDTCGIIFANKVMTNSGSNITCLMFDLLDFEQINGRCITTETSATCGNIVINKISIENGRSASLVDLKSKAYESITTNELMTYRNAYHFNPLLSFKAVGMIISSISTDNVGICSYYADGNTESGLYTDSILEVAGNIAIGNIAMPGVMTAILTKPYTSVFDCVIISGFKSFSANSFTPGGRKVANFVYLVPITGNDNGTTLVKILDETIIVDYDIVKYKGNGFWSGIDMTQFFLPHRGWQNYGLVDGKYCYHVFNNAQHDGFLNNIKLAPGKKLRMRIQSKYEVIGDMCPLNLLDVNDNVVATANSSIGHWYPDTWVINEYTIPNDDYYKLSISFSRACDIEWIEIV